jgi:serine/threonine-protein kinase
MSAPQAARQNHASEEDVFIPLRGDFSFAHEPLDEMECDRFVARSDDLLKFVRRVINSRGGTFLLTGYRGVGKTSFVNQAV